MRNNCNYEENILYTSVYPQPHRQWQSLLHIPTPKPPFLITYYLYPIILATTIIKIYSAGGLLPKLDKVL
jgi:hypothetical protein